ncbi:MAG: hypothetical protein G01um101466_614 [Parcubacteria group bacterium Gr01-1014_66]|nr:MAG: hypothetical protein G01um101466_614 [Parcubacteria group bacterium Gr01-1014_66]
MSTQQLSWIDRFVWGIVKFGAVMTVLGIGVGIVYGIGYAIEEITRFFKSDFSLIDIALLLICIGLPTMMASILFWCIYDVIRDIIKNPPERLI